MNKKSYFEYDKFMMLSGSELCDYMEPLLKDRSTVVHFGVLNRMLHELPTYDEYHLVYALTLGAKYLPETYAIQLPQYLTNNEGSIWTTALNSLDQLPDEHITISVINAIHKVHSLHPEKPWITDILERLEKRVRQN